MSSIVRPDNIGIPLANVPPGTHIIAYYGYRGWRPTYSPNALSMISDLSDFSVQALTLSELAEMLPSPTSSDKIWQGARSDLGDVSTFSQVNGYYDIPIGDFLPLTVMIGGTYDFYFTFMYPNGSESDFSLAYNVILTDLAKPCPGSCGS